MRMLSSRISLVLALYLLGVAIGVIAADDIQAAAATSSPSLTPTRDADPHADSYAHANANPHADSYAHANADPHTDSYPHADADPHADSYPPRRRPAHRLIPPRERRPAHRLIPPHGRRPAHRLIPPRGRRPARQLTPPRERRPAHRRRLRLSWGKSWYRTSAPTSLQSLGRALRGTLRRQRR